MSIPCGPVDQAVSNRIVQIVNSDQLHLALDVLQELEKRDDALQGQWRMRLQRADYDAQLAQRRYEQVDPANRLVAASLEQRWNEALSRLEEIRQEFADYYTYYRVGIGYEQRHEYAKAIEEFQRALSEEPRHVESIYLLASCLARLKREQEAIPYARKAAQMAPGSAMVHGLLGGLLSSTGQYREALTHLEAAYAASPGDVSVANNLAWVLATCPEAAYRDGPRALRLAESACKATSYKSPPLLDSLAAAYAEVGQFDRAVRTTQQAIEIVRSNPKTSTETLASRLELYEAGRPYREPARQ